MTSFQPVGSGWSTTALIVSDDPAATCGAETCALVAVVVATATVPFTVSVSFVGVACAAGGGQPGCTSCGQRNATMWMNTFGSRSSTVSPQILTTARCVSALRFD